MQVPHVTFIIDTIHHTENFQYEMFAWITGHLEFCTRANSVAKRANLELPAEVREWFAHNCLRLRDASDALHAPVFYRPFTACPTPGWVNTGLGDEYPDNTPEHIMLADYRTKVRHFNLPEIARLEHRVSADGLWPQESILQEVARLYGEIHKADALTQVDRYPSYRSLGIYLRETPAGLVLATMKERALSFKGCGKVTGFRLAKEVIHRI